MRATGVVTAAATMRAAAPPTFCAMLRLSGVAGRHLVMSGIGIAMTMMIIAVGIGTNAGTATSIAVGSDAAERTTRVTAVAVAEVIGIMTID